MKGNNSPINSTKEPKYKLCTVCGTYTDLANGCSNINHFINTKRKGKKDK